MRFSETVWKVHVQGHRKHGSQPPSTVGDPWESRNGIWAETRHYSLFPFFFLSLQNCFPWDSVLLCPRSKGFIFHEQMSDNFIVFYNPFSCLILLACDLMLNISETPHADCSGHFETIWIETTGQQIQRESQAINHQQTSRRVFSHTLWGEG